MFLKATSVNIGDSILPTTVSANLQLQSTELVIKSVEFTGFIQCVSSSSPNPCYKVKNALSIPPLNEKNVFHKYLLVKYETESSTTKITFTNIQIFIVPNGLSQIKIHEGKVDDADGTIKQIDKLTLKIRVSFTNPNTINFAKFANFQFKIVLSYTSSENQDPDAVQTAEKLSDKMTALWKAPYFNIPSKRYSTIVDKGDDCWSSVNMGEWIQANAETGLWSRYNDISGEHTLNLGHSSHELGNHVDIFHYYTLDASSGGANYNAFLTAVKKNETSKVKEWIVDHRQKFDQLNSDNKVVEFKTHRGTPIDKNLNNNWLRFLMETGKIENFMNLELNSWESPTKANWVSDHKDHIHIQIR